MKASVKFLLITLIFFVGTNLQAQVQKTLDPSRTQSTLTPVKDPNARVGSKTVTRASTKGIDPATKLAKGEKVYNVNSYKIEFQPNPLTSESRIFASIKLYSGIKEVGIINFHEEYSEMMKKTRPLNEQNYATFSYKIDHLELMENFLKRNQRVIIIYNEETKTAYLSSGTNSTRSR